MGKYALILAFSYNRVLGAKYDIQYLHSAINDVDIMVALAESRGIQSDNITIVMDLLPGKSLNSRISKCNVRTNPYPSDIFVCREISQFIENTVRGIDDASYKNEGEGPEILLYFSCHGKRLGSDRQGIILTNEDGKSLKYLLAKDIFRMIFGDLPITEDAHCDIPIYSEYQLKKHTENGSYIEKYYNEEKVTVVLTPTIASPENSPLFPTAYRSSYSSHRGIPVNAKMLVIVDTCYSEHMAYFPFTYDQKSQEMSSTGNLDTNIGIDLPYCLAISSCESDKTTGFVSESSSLTGILYRTLLNCDVALNIAQLHYCIYNSRNPRVIDILKRGAAHPIITSTSDSSNVEIPFFNSLNKTEKKQYRIIEK